MDSSSEGRSESTFNVARWTEQPLSAHGGAHPAIGWLKVYTSAPARSAVNLPV